MHVDFLFGSQKSHFSLSFFCTGCIPKNQISLNFPVQNEKSSKEI